MMTTNLLLRMVQCLLLTDAVLLKGIGVCAEPQRRVAAIEITESKYIGSNAIRVSWKTELHLPFDAVCRLTLTSYSENTTDIITTVRVSQKHYVFWNIMSKSANYSVSIVLLTSEQLLPKENIDFSPKYKSIPLEVRQPVMLSHCQIHIENGFTKLLDITKTSEVIFTEDDIISLSCDVTGNPLPRIRWFKDGATSEGSSLTLRAANKSHEGIYSFVADNRFGTAVFPGVRLRMAVLDAFSAVDQIPKYTVEAGVGLTIDCRYSAQSIPEASFRWYRLNYKNDPSPTPVSPDNSRVQLSVSGSLVFVNTMTTDSGLYMCMARNSELDKSVAGSLTQIEVTESHYNNFSLAPLRLFKSFETQKAFVGENISIQCIFSGRPIPETVWFVRDFQLTDQLVTDESSLRFKFQQSGTMLTLVNVSENSPDRFTCKGRNTEGTSLPLHFQILIYGKPEFLVTPQSANATVGDTVTFTYLVTGRPKPTVMWKSKGKPLVSGPSMFINDSSLTFFNVSKNSSGSLQVNASNAFGYVLINVFLCVYAPTVISFVQNDFGTPGIASFRCDAETDPSTPLEINWLHNNKPLSSTFPYIPYSYASYEENMVDTRVVDQATLLLDLKDGHLEERRSPVVNFTCLASNGVSYARKTIVYRRPSVDRNVYPSLQDSVKDQTLGLSESSPITYLGYAACGAILLLIASVVTFRLKNRSCSRPTSAASATAAAAASATSLSLASDFDGSMTLPSNECRRAIACRRHSGTCPGQHQHQHQLRCDSSQQCRGHALPAALYDMCIPRDRIQITDTIAQGRFSKVLLALLHDPRGELRENVVVKSLNSELSDAGTMELFLKEPEVAIKFQHVNVLGVLGVTLERNGSPFIVQPFMASGDLRSHITNPRMDMTVLHLLQLGLQVVRGMVYLSSLPIVHCHLRTKACMVNSRGIVKVADFGLTRELIIRNYHRDPQNDLSIVMRWMAFETLEANLFTTMSDVWSFGVLLWELMTRGALPYAEAKDLEILNIIQAGQKLPQPPSCRDDIYALMSACWSLDPLQRPNFRLIEETIFRIVHSAQRGSQCNPAIYVNMILPPSNAIDA